MKKKNEKRNTKPENALSEIEIKYLPYVYFSFSEEQQKNIHLFDLWVAILDYCVDQSPKFQVFMKYNNMQYSV